MTKTNLSLLVAAYNVEDTLEKCIVSLEKQDISVDSYEVIIVNDGSTDTTLALAKSLAKQYSNIKVISQENKKLSGARKTGIENAQGEYLMFIDGDDYLQENCLSFLLNTVCASELDILSFCFETVDLTGKRLPQEIRPQMPSLIFSGSDFMFTKYMKNSLVGNVFRRELFENKEIVLSDGINKAEDKMVTYQVFYFAKKVQYIPNRLYFYARNPHSICHTMSIDSFVDWLNVTNFLVLFAKQKVKQSNIQKKYFSHLNEFTQTIFFYASSMIQEQSAYEQVYAKAKELQLTSGDDEEGFPANLSDLQKLFRKEQMIENAKIFINKYTYKFRQRKHSVNIILFHKNS
ncbi:MAG: glycosyltransferase [Candidatus Symbiothrix sp.]|jgi:glycosyltransferase involved in cell wall biosynthesis|nr:glycosyltransferase [Candidatus Symbiothrix sp.]